MQLFQQKEMSELEKAKGFLLQKSYTKIHQNKTLSTLSLDHEFARQGSYFDSMLFLDNFDGPSEAGVFRLIPLFSPK